MNQVYAGLRIDSSLQTTHPYQCELDFEKRSLRPQTLASGVRPGSLERRAPSTEVNTMHNGITWPDEGFPVLYPPLYEPVRGLALDSI